jgi:3-hydroxybutyryl-CoA dehydrogenase
LLSNEDQKEELTAQGFDDSARLIVDNDLQSLSNENSADACIDLLYDHNSERINDLNRLQIPVIIVNSVIHTLNELPPGFIRINAWNTFLKRPVIETAGPEDQKDKIEQVFSFFNKRTEWVPDIAGFISCRVVASIINEAYFALEENVSTKDEIDAALKLGANYPYGPFEWSRKIGLKNVYDLLNRLSAYQKRYAPSSLLTKEASS